MSKKSQSKSRSSQAKNRTGPALKSMPKAKREALKTARVKAFWDLEKRVVEKLKSGLERNQCKD